MTDNSMQKLIKLYEKLTGQSPEPHWNKGLLSAKIQEIEKAIEQETGSMIIEDVTANNTNCVDMDSYNTLLEENKKLKTLLTEPAKTDVIRAAEMQDPEVTVRIRQRTYKFAVRSKGTIQWFGPYNAGDVIKIPLFVVKVLEQANKI